MTNVFNPRTIQRRISSLKSICKFALKEQFFEADFMLHIKPPKSAYRLPIYMNMSELRQLLQSLEKSQHRVAVRNEAMFKLMATTGMRRYELVALSWGQLDFFNQTIRIFGNGKKERLLPLHSSVVQY